MLDVIVISSFLGIGLAMDACAVSMANGMNEPKMKFRKGLLISVMFGFFQGLMPFLGYLVGANTLAKIEWIIPWVALVLLGFIGSKMLIEDKCYIDTKKIDFTTIDSMDWTISNYTITVDLNGEDAPNCTYQKTSCKKPDQFQFIVNGETGEVHGSDPLTKAYLQNPNKLNNKKEDFNTADSYST